MRVIQLGDTTTEIPEIGLGTAGYTVGPEALRRGIALGATLLDTAESYRTEDRVGEAVAGIRDQVFIATKVSRSHFRLDDIITAADRSLGLLGTDHIDLYQLHQPGVDVPIEETMAAMDRLVDAGKVRFIGVSNFSLEQLNEAQAASRHKIVANQVQYSLFARSIEEELLPYCQQNAVTIIAYSPLAAHGGLDYLTGRKSHEALEAVSRATGKTPAQVALNWCTSKEGVMAIPKSNSVQRTEENCAASGWRLSEGHMTLLEEAFK